MKLAPSTLLPLVSFCFALTAGLAAESAPTPDTAKSAPADAVKLVPVANRVVFSGDYIAIETADRKPIPTFQSRPRYPVALRNAGIHGEALIAFIVDKDGLTTEVQVEKASDKTFGEAAQQAVSKWKFKPGMKNGEPIRVAMKVPVVFTLEK